MNGGNQDPGEVRVRMSSFCTDRGCVGVVVDDGEVLVVDTKGERPSLSFTHEEWTAFVAGVKAGEFDLGRSA